MLSAVVSAIARTSSAESSAHSCFAAASANAARSSSLQPCPMCASAACWARMEGVVYCTAAEDRPKDENFDHWIYVKPEEIFENYKYAPKLVKEFMRQEGKEKIEELGGEIFCIEKIGSVLGAHLGIGGIGVFFLNKKGS